jgi:TolB-like protein/DNA-binding winged helix-turn-helix (wHTH) protein/Tfp pilus assembly protein PilF
MLDSFGLNSRMPTPASTSKIVRFGVFELDLQRAELRKQGVKVKLQEQPLTVLQVLLENPGQIVSRDELRRRVWSANTFVEFDQGLYSAMARLRDVLGDSSDSPRFIETVARRGYRFIAPVSPPVAPIPVEITRPTEGDQQDFRRHSLRRWISSLLAGLLGGALLLVIVFTFDIAGAREWLTSRSTPIRSIAVLPLQNLPNDPGQEYFADGMTDELITDLAQLADLRVISRTSVMRYKKTEKSLPEIARELNVDAVVEGTVARVGNRVRIRVQLVRARDDRHLWARAYDREFQDIFSLQNDAAHEIAEQVGLGVNSHKPQPANPRRSMKPEAYESYIRGLFYSRTGNPDDAQKAKANFEQAIRQDPKAGLAYAALADVYIYETYFGVRFGVSRTDAVTNARTFARKALELNPDLAAPHLVMTGIAEIDWEWAEAEKQYEQALELEPGSSEAHLSYGMFRAAQGDFAQSISETQIALRLDPVSAQTHASSGFTYYLAGKFDTGISQSKKALELDPSYDDAHANLFYSYIQKGMYDEAIGEFEKMAAMWRYSPESLAEIKRAYKTGGIHAFWIKQIELNAAQRIPTLDSFEVASIYALVGQKSKALEFLERAWEERDPKMGFIKVLPELASLRGEPKFQELVQRMRLASDSRTP